LKDSEQNRLGDEVMENKKEVLISLKDVTVEFDLGKTKFRAACEVNFDIYKGETFSLVGESGSGKTTIGRAIMRINPTKSGDIIFNGEKINGKLDSKKLKALRQNIQMIFQDPMASLNERAKIDYIISEGLYNYKLYKNEKERKEKVAKALISVGLFPDFASRFPHEFSGGQRQRIGIARALIMEPQFVIADEPISALDVSIRAQVINLLNKLKKEHDLTYLFIAHDLSVVRFISDRIAVIYKGRIVELAESEELYNNPIHPYTKSLLSAIPIPDPDLEKDKVLYEYNPGINNYDENPPKWVEINEGHFIWANDEEILNYREGLK
jgi:ABC-type oligopeptide transport system ATPase subunit